MAERYREFAAAIALRNRKLAESFITRAGSSGLSVDGLATMLPSLAVQLITEVRLGLSDPQVSAGERMVAIIIELLGMKSESGA